MSIAESATLFQQFFLDSWWPNALFPTSWRTRTKAIIRAIQKAKTTSIRSPQVPRTAAVSAILATSKIIPVLSGECEAVKP